MQIWLNSGELLFWDLLAATSFLCYLCLLLLLELVPAELWIILFKSSCTNKVEVGFDTFTS